MKRMLLLIALSSGLFNDALSQGCSDAGFCTLNPFKPLHSVENDFKNQLKFGLNTGVADHNIAIWGSYVEYSRKINSKLGLTAKLTSLAQQGNGISVNDLSDIFINANLALTEKLRITGGFKFPLANGNRSLNNLSLPMDYQSSLGTTDAIAGVSYSFRKWQGVLAFQIPLSQNKNTFQAEAYPSTLPLSGFQSTNGFTRKADVMLRLSYPIKFKSKLTVTPGLLAIYHLANDEFIDAQMMKAEIKGSQGLTLNATLFFDYLLSKKSALQFNLGSPLVVRDARPDGLTRGIIGTIEYSVQF